MRPRLKSELLTKIYTDGSALPNGQGSWSFIIESPYLENSGFRRKTNNNEMEFVAAIEALREFKSDCLILSDSRILIDQVTLEYPKWLRAPFKLFQLDLLHEISELSLNRTVSWQWVKSHNGNQLNERCDALCREKLKI